MFIIHFYLVSGSTPSSRSKRKGSEFVFSLQSSISPTNRPENNYISSIEDLMQILFSQQEFYSEELYEKIMIMDSTEHYNIDRKTLINFRDQLSRMISFITNIYKTDDSTKNNIDSEKYQQFILAIASISIRTLQKLVQESEFISEEYFIKCCDILAIIISSYSHNITTLQYHKFHELIQLFSQSLSVIKISNNIAASNMRIFLNACLSESMKPLRIDILSLISKLLVVCQTYHSFIEDISVFVIQQSDHFTFITNSIFYLPYELLHNILKEKLYSSLLESYEKTIIQGLEAIINSFIRPFLDRLSDKHLSISTITSRLLHNSIQSLLTNHDPIDLLIIHCILYNIFTMLEILKSSDPDIISHILDILIDIGPSITIHKSKDPHKQTLHDAISKTNIDIYSINILLYESSTLFNTPLDEYIKLFDKESLPIDDPLPIMNQLFAQLLQPIIFGLVSILLSLSGHSSATIRSKSIRGLTNIFPSIYNVDHPNIHQLMHTCIKHRLHDDSGLARDASFEFLSKNHNLFIDPYSLLSFQQDILNRLSDTSISVRKRCIRLLSDLYKVCILDRQIILDYLLSCLFDKETTVREISQSTMLKCFTIHNDTDFNTLSTMLYNHISVIDDQTSRDHIISCILRLPESFISMFIDHLIKQSIISELHSCYLLDALTSITTETSILQPHHTIMLIQHISNMKPHQTLHHVLNILIHSLPYITTLSKSTCIDLEKTLFSMLTRFPDFIIDPAIHLIGILIQKNLSIIDPIESLWIKLYETILKYINGNPIPIPMISRSLYICSLVTRYISNIHESLSDCSTKLIDVISSIYGNREANIAISDMCIHSLGNVLICFPKLVLSMNVKQMIERALSNTSTQITCLSFLCKIMIQIDSASLESLKDNDPSSIAAAIAQMYYPLMLPCITTRNIQVQSAAIKLMNVFFSSGLLHPGLVAPYYIFIESINNEHLMFISKDTLMILRDRHSGFAYSRIKDSIVLLYEYLRPHNGFIIKDESRISLLQSHFMATRSKKILKLEFFRMISSFFEWPDNILSSLSIYNDMNFLKFVIEIIGYLILKTEDEVIMLLKILIKIMLTSGCVILNIVRSNDMKQVKHVAQSLLWLNELIYSIKQAYGITDKYYSSIIENNKKQVAEKPVQRTLVALNLGYDTLLDTDTLIDKLEDVVYEQTMSDEEYSNVKSKKKKKGIRSTRNRRGNASMIVDDEKSSEDELDLDE